METGLYFFKEALIVILLGFAVVLVVVGIRLIITFQKAIRSTEIKLGDVRDSFVDVKKSIIAAVDNTKPVLDKLLQDVNETKVETISALSNLNQMIDEAKTLTAKFNDEAEGMFETLNNIGHPIKNAVEIVSKPIQKTSRIANAFGKAVDAFKNKLQTKSEKTTDYDS